MCLQEREGPDGNSCSVKDEEFAHTRTVLAPDSDGLHVPSHELLCLEHLVHCAPQRAPTRIHLWPSLPNIIVGEYERLLGNHGAMTEERAALAPPEAFVIDFNEVLERPGCVTGDEGIERCRADQTLDSDGCMH